MASKSKSAIYRQELKERDPEKFRLHQEREAARSRKKRAEKKEKRESGVMTRSEKEAFEQEREKTRIRAAEWYKKNVRSSRSKRYMKRLPVDSSAKKPRDMTPQEYTVHRRGIRERWWARLSAQKKTWLLKKRAASAREYRRRKNVSQCTPKDGSGRLAKKFYNLASKVRSKLTKKNASPNTYARFIKNMANPRSPSKRAAIRQLNFTSEAPPPKPTPKQCSGCKCKHCQARSQAKHTMVKAFFLRYDVARQLPHARYATRAGPGYVMNMTLKGAYRLYMEERPDYKIGFSSFAAQRPKNVRLLGSVAAETCLCLYCLNVRYKVSTLNRHMARSGSDVKFQSESRLPDFFLCPRAEGERFHEPKCIHCTCPACMDWRRPFIEACSGQLDDSLVWMRWERRLGRLDVHSKSGTLRQLLEELVSKDLLAPVKSVTFTQHLFTAHWQYQQFLVLKGSLSAKDVLMVMDFAENRKAMYNEEVKSAHFGKSQITLHPVVAYYMRDGQLVRHCVNFITDDIQHDYHAVHAFTVASLEFFESVLPGARFFIYSDGCAAQYKGRGAFADLSLYSMSQVQRLFYGSEHGKGEADGETGVISQALRRAVSADLVVRDARDLYTWCVEHLKKDDPGSKRDFFILERESINRLHPETEVQTLPGTRKLHQIQRVSNYVLRARHLACFCGPCRGDSGLCDNEKYVQPFETYVLKPKSAPKLDDALAQDNMDHNDSPPTPLGDLDQLSPRWEDNSNSPPAAGNLDHSSPRWEESPATPPPDVETPPPPASLNQAFVESPSHKQARSPHLSDFMALTYQVGRNNKLITYYAQVVEPGYLLAPDEFQVNFMREQQGGYFVFPTKEDKSVVSDKDLVGMVFLPVPRIDNRGRHYF